MNKAFTIVELLIVIVVIGILTSITVVSFNGLQNRAHDSSARTTTSQLQRKVELRNATYGSYICATCTTTPQIINEYSLGSLVSGSAAVYPLSDTWEDGFEFDKDKVAVIYQPTADAYNVRWISIAYWNNSKQRWTSTTYRDAMPPETRDDPDVPATPGWVTNDSVRI